MRLVVYSVLYMLRVVANSLRRVGRAPDYVTLSIEKPLSEMPPPAPPIPQRWLSGKRESLMSLRKTLRHVAADHRVRGIVFHLRDLSAPLAQLQSLRDLILEMRKAGKRIVVWAPSYSLSTYYVACAADEILLQPGGTVALLGLSATTTFLGEALERLGLRGDFIAISPYKTAADQLTRKRMSTEAREMNEWLIGDHFDQLVDGMATGRKLDRETIRAWVDAGIHFGQDALDAGLVDALWNEDDLPKALGDKSQPARLTSYVSARRRLVRPAPTRPGRYVAVLRIGGSIVDGRSSRPPFRSPFSLPFLFNERAGDLTVVAQARRVAGDRRAAAVVVHVDSGGGSADASEAMYAALRVVAEKKPLVVSMGNVAASGGYYVAMPGAHVVAQAGTVTGSIGVLYGKLVDVGALDRLLIHRETIERGARAGLFSSTRMFDDEERKLVRTMIERIYELFLSRVCEGRAMDRDAVDAVGGGRVWTGRQALTHGLIDELGGLERAIAEARSRAGLPDSAAVRIVAEPKGTVAPGSPHAMGAVEYAFEGLRPLLRAAPRFLASVGYWEDD